MTKSETIKALGDLHVAAASPSQLIDWTLNDLGSRIGSDFAVWTQISAGGELRSAMLGKGIDHSVWHYGPAIQQNLATDHPILHRYFESGQGYQAGRITDFAPQRIFDRTALCQEAYRHLGMRRQLALIFQGPDGGVCTFAFGRTGRDFSLEHSQAASEFTLHLQIAFERLWHIEMLTHRQETASTARFRATRLDEGWHYSLIDEPSAALVAKHFGEAKSFLVPFHLARHFRGSETRRGIPDVDGRKWTLTVSPRPNGEMSVTVHREAEALETPGLTRREAEILHWIAQGKRDAEISAILGISSRTVGKHIENILSKLGVETRGAAVAAALSRQR